MWTPQSDGKRERLCFIEHKDNSFFRIATFFYEKTFLFFGLTQGETKTRGLFFDLPLVSLIALPLSLVSLLLWGGKSVAAFSLHSAFVPFPAPSGQCALAHDALARGDAHPRLAHSASFHFFSFTHHLQPTELLLVRCEGFCISMISSRG